ncbi:MAG: hypothetical protein ABSG54_09420 [Terriglobia bacterium]
MRTAKRSFGLPLLVGLALAMGIGAFAQDDLGPMDAAAKERFDAKMLSAYEGTPLPVVEKMLELAQVRPGELVYDLGSGDGRIVVMAVQKFGARAVGIELDPRLARRSTETLQHAALIPQARIIEGDVLEQDLSPADVVTVYMTPYGMGKLRSRLEKQLRPGARVVICVDQIPGWAPATVIQVAGGSGRTYRLTLYVIPKARDWASYSKFGDAH